MLPIPPPPPAWAHLGGPVDVQRPLAAQDVMGRAQHHHVGKVIAETQQPVGTGGGGRGRQRRGVRKRPEPPPSAWPQGSVEELRETRAGKAAAVRAGGA